MRSSTTDTATDAPALRTAARDAHAAAPVDALDRAAPPSATPSTTNSPPWSLVDFFGSEHGGTCGYAYGNLQPLIAGSDTTHLEVTVAAESLMAADTFTPTVDNWDAFVDWHGPILNYVQHRTR